MSESKRETKVNDEGKEKVKVSSLYPEYDPGFKQLVGLRELFTPDFRLVVVISAEVELLNLLVPVLCRELSTSTAGTELRFPTGCQRRGSRETCEVFPGA